MRTIQLDVKKMTGLPEMHRYLRRVLELPVYYGSNLDGLYDCLTEMNEETELIIPQDMVKEEYLGWYGTQLLQVFKDAAEENDALKLKIQQLLLNKVAKAALFLYCGKCDRRTQF